MNTKGLAMDESRMCIVIADMLYPLGHKRINEYYINQLAKTSKIYVLDYNNYYSDINESIFISKIKISKLFLPNRILPLVIMANVINLFKLRIKLRNIKYDRIIFFTIENVSFSLFHHIFGSKNVIVFHHNNLDKITNLFSRFVFSIFNKSIKHACFAEYINEYLVKSLNFPSKNVHVINLPIFDSCDEVYIDNSKTSFRTKKILAIGHSNDEAFINSLINFNIASSFDLSKIQFIIRVKKITFEPEYIRLIHGFLNYDQYRNLISESSAGLLIYPSNFKYRYSGFFMDLFVSQKIVYTTPTLFGKHIKYLYPNNVRIINSVEDLIIQAINDDYEFDLSEYNHFKSIHGEAGIFNELSKLVG